MSQNFYPDELRPGQFRDLPIINQWGNMKMLPVSFFLFFLYSADHPRGSPLTGKSYTYIIRQTHIHTIKNMKIDKHYKMSEK